MHCHLHVPLAQVQVSGNLRVRSGALVAPNETLQLLEKLGFICSAEFLPQSSQDLLDQGNRPAGFIRVVRIKVIRRLYRVAILRCVRVDRKKLQTPTTFQTGGPLPLVDQKVFQGSQQERAELTATGIGLREVILLQKTGKEALCQILRIFRAVSLPPGE